jgi:hypothetical protein
MRFQGGVHLRDRHGAIIEMHLTTGD